MLISLLAVAAAVSSCKTDSEGDVIPPASDVTELYINEVYASNPDWVELYNGSDKDMDISGFILQDEKGAEEEYIIPDGTVIKAGECLVIDQFSFGLSSSKGDTVTLLDAEGNSVDAVSFPVMEDGTSYGRAEDGDNTWKVFNTPTKGASNSGDGQEPEPSEKVKVLINEVQSAPADDDVDFVELYNGEDTTLDLGGFILQDEKGAAEEFVIPEGTVVEAGGLVVFSQVSPGEGVGFTFGLGSKGDKVILLDADRNVLDEIDTPDFGDTKGQSYARVGNGGAQWQILDTPTKGTDNPEGQTPGVQVPVVINEVYTFSDQTSIDDLDWIELYNTSDSEVEIGGMKLWESGGVEEAWTVPAGTVIAARGRLLIEADKEGLHGDPEHYPSWGLSKGPDEYVVFADADMNIIDEVELPSMNENESYGRVTDGAEEWQIFAMHTKGEPNTGASRPEHTNTTGLFINEVYHDDQDEPVNGEAWTTTDFIELYNANDTPLDISGWEIYDDKGEDVYVIPEGTVVPAKGFLTYDVYKENPDGPSFGLGVGGDWVFVYKSGKSELVDSVEVPGFPKDGDMRGKGYTYGRATDGGDEWTIFSEGSKNASNNDKTVLE